jgi:hypothetical protein
VDFVVHCKVIDIQQFKQRQIPIFGRRSIHKGFGPVLVGRVKQHLAQRDAQGVVVQLVVDVFVLNSHVNIRDFDLQIVNNLCDQTFHHSGLLLKLFFGFLQIRLVIASMHLQSTPGTRHERTCELPFP